MMLNISFIYTDMRRGAILLIVAGLAGLLVSLSVAYLAMVQRSISNSDQVVLEAQARIMLHAGCAYVVESSRLGYDKRPVLASGVRQNLNGDDQYDGSEYQHREGHGWADVRDSSTGGGVGPRDQKYSAGAYRFAYLPAGSPSLPPDGEGKPAWPQIGGVAICPMYRWSRPPYAISGRASYNPVIVDPINPTSASAFPKMANHDPEPVSDQPGLSSGFLKWAQGDSAPVSQSMGMAWFRVRRHSATRFIVTCGAGGTMGFKSYDERVKNIEGRGVSDYFSGREEFNSLLKHEFRSWYEIQWSAAVRPISPGVMPWDYRFATGGTDTLWEKLYGKSGRWNDQRSVMVSRPVNSSLLIENDGDNFYSSSTFPRPPASFAPCGTISYIQRLKNPPMGTHPDTGLTWDW